MWRKNMKVVLLAGGAGTRIMEESESRPKPMVEIGGMPIIWHIMKEYSYYGFNEFIICAGYKQHMIKRWFADYFLYKSDVTFQFSLDNQITVHKSYAEDWKVTVVDTGGHTMTGGRLKRVQEYIDGDTFMLTYGDGVCDVDISKLVEYHKSHGKLATLTAVRMKQDKGTLDIGFNNSVRAFREKNSEDSRLINAGYMVLNTKIFDYLKDDNTVLEREPMERLAAEGQLMSYQHEGFWQCMDTMLERMRLEELLMNDRAPWKKW